MWMFAIAGGLCWLGAALAMAAAGRASGSARRAFLDHRAASSARIDAETSARVARTVTGIDFSFDQAHAAETDVSRRIAQDLRIAAATAQRINARAAVARRAPQRPIDLFVKPTT